MAMETEEQRSAIYREHLVAGLRLEEMGRAWSYLERHGFLKDPGQDRDAAAALDALEDGLLELEKLNLEAQLRNGELTGESGEVKLVRLAKLQGLIRCKKCKRYFHKSALASSNTKGMCAVCDPIG